MVGKEKLFSFLERGLAASKSPQTEIVALSRTLRVARFANSIIHQPMEERDVSLQVRVLYNGRIGFASTNGLSEQALLSAVKRAEESAGLHQAPQLLEHFSRASAVVHLDGYSANTYSTGTEQIEQKVKSLISVGKKRGVSFAGVFWTSSGETAVVNSNGVKLHHPWTQAHCQTVAAKGDLSGYSSQSSKDIQEINPEQIGEAAVHRTLRFPESRELPPGDYPCLMEEYAVAELLMYLAWMAFTADSLEEGRSILESKKGQKVASPLVSIWDDALNPQTFQVPFDTEGTPVKKVVFVNQGIGQDVVYDLVTAKRNNTESTGHALPSDYSEGPLPLHLEMAPGDTDKDAMLKQMKRGLLVTRFHYIREVHPLKTMVTGMTRDGVFLVENGEVTARVKNFRFTESILGAFSHVNAISRQRKLIAADMETPVPGGFFVPKVFVEKFAFTGATHF